MSKRAVVRRRRAISGGVHRSQRSHEAVLQNGVALEPGVLCSAVALTFGATFVFGGLIGVVAFGDSILELLTGTVIGLAFAGMGSVLFCLAIERPVERTREVAPAIRTGVLVATTVTGLVFGLLV